MLRYKIESLPFSFTSKIVVKNETSGPIEITIFQDRDALQVMKIEFGVGAGTAGVNLGGGVAKKRKHPMDGKFQVPPNASQEAQISSNICYVHVAVDQKTCLTGVLIKRSQRVTVLEG